MKFKYCKNNCLEKIYNDSGSYHLYKCDCNEYKLTIRKDLYKSISNQFIISGVIVHSYYRDNSSNPLFLFRILYKDLIEISLDGNFIFDLDLNYMLNDQYILDKIISYWENLIFK